LQEGDSGLLRAAAENEELIVAHQPSASIGREVAVQYLQWLAKRSRQPIVLVWDLLATHHDHQVHKFVRELGIRLTFIPPGLMDECQALDRRVFGNLKQRAHRRFDNEILQGRLKLLVDV
jgi:hypothetical protein